MGPRYLVRAAGLEMHPIDQADRLSFLKDEGNVAPLRPGTIDRAESGKPQTILLVGSDRRFDDKAKDARSDTLMLVRIDHNGAAGAERIRVRAVGCRGRCPDEKGR